MSKSSEDRQTIREFAKAIEDFHVPELHDENLREAISVIMDVTVKAIRRIASTSEVGP